MTDLRKYFWELIVDKASEDDKLNVLIADSGFGVIDKFKEKYWNRFFNFGLCEQTIVGIAAGMSLEGKKVILYGITPFILERPFEQIKLDVDQQNANVIIAGYADFPEDGPTHNPLDLEIMSKLFKNIKFYFPNTEQELKEVFNDAYNRSGPSFIRLTRL